MSESNDKITPEFLQALYFHLRTKEQTIGIGHETAVQKAVRQRLGEAQAGRAAKQLLAARVHSEMRAIKNKAANLKTAVSQENIIAEAERLENDITLAAEMLEVLEND